MTKLESVQLRRHYNSKATPTSRQSIWHIISIFCFFCSKILRFEKFRLAYLMLTRGVANVDTGRGATPLVTLNKQKFALISQLICVACYIRCDLDL